ncbi:MAG: hypothetical protein KF781_07040 [Chitinophagaceae bacterium]|nr:hypothetical protein [Chitinophagaceae bacterium]MCW5904023.1 hypothetical protein [Chitinophagaceae bacterium]
MRKFSIILIAIFTFSYTNAQVIDTTALQGYPASVLIRVYDVAGKVTLSSAEQLVLAELFQEEGQSIKTMIISNANNAAIDSAKRYYTNEFNLLLSEQQREAYYTAKSAPKAAVIARLTATMLQQKYYTDTTMENYFHSIYLWRESLLEKIWLRYTDTTVRNNNLYHVMVVYDSLASLYIQAAASNRYFSNKVYYIDSITVLDTAKKRLLATDYFQRCMTYKSRSYADNFNAAFNHTFTALEDTLYYAAAYNNEIVQLTYKSAETALASYIKSHHLSTVSAQQILPYLLERERAVTLIDKLYNQLYDSSKDAALDNILQKYQPPIDSLLALDADIIDNTQIDIAIKFAELLQLREEQVNELKEQGSVLTQMIRDYRRTDPFGEYDSKEFESEVLNALLTPEQYTQVLDAKYAGKAASMAKLDWKQIQLYEMDIEYQLNENTTKTELSNYHLAQLIAYYRNADNLEEQYLSIQRINEVMPEIMRSLLERWEYQTPYGDIPGVFFQW